MRGYSLLFFMFCINAGIFIVNAAGILPSSTPSPLDPTSIWTVALLSGDFNALLVGLFGAAGLGGIIALFVRQYVNAGVAILIWSVGMLVPFVQIAFGGLPLLLTILGIPWYITTWIYVFCAFAFIIFIVEVTSQRQIS